RQEKFTQRAKRTQKGKDEVTQRRRVRREERAMKPGMGSRGAMCRATSSATVPSSTGLEAPSYTKREAAGGMERNRRRKERSNAETQRTQRRGVKRGRTLKRTLH